ncbi:HlyD family secretion protein [Zobellia laminariae]|uniref:HlyD family efflux transporter periplasmic adaptor subunit n=1 Tax=Zobellia laminariae TaxID=248906 RepID=UPI0012D92D78|nr:HlyD family efflux transporter periplasmic adaptor subunit [Zobellia laminariae]
MPKKEDDIQLRSEEVHEILTYVPHWMIRWGNLLFLTLIIMLLIISWLIKYPDIIQSQAIITTQKPPQKEYAKISGKFETILVENNEKVLPYQLLAILENSANYNDVVKLKSIIDTLKVSKNSFNFHIDSLPVLFLGEIDSDYALFENSYMQFFLNKKLRPFSNEALANKSSILELTNRLKSLNLQRELNISEMDFKRKDLERYRQLFEKGIISAQDYENKQLDHLQSERNFKNMSLSISQIKEAIGNAKKISKGTEINRTKEEVSLLKSVIHSFNQLKRSLKDWELRYVLKSNIDGKVSFLDFWDKNQSVEQGDLVFTIIPTNRGSYVAKLRIPSWNSGKVKHGQTVNIKLDNYPNSEFGVLQGKVKSVSLTADNDGLYLVDVNLAYELETTFHKKIEFKQEMSGVAEIITEDLRLIERFFYQFNELFKR